MPRPYRLVAPLAGLCVVMAFASAAEPPADDPKHSGAMEQAWADLADPAPPVVLRALLALADHPDEATPFLEKRLAAPADEQIAKWVAALDAHQFDDRQRAEERLAGIADLAVPQLQKALKNKPPLEVHRRITQLLDVEGLGAVYQTRLRAVRAIAVLEHIGTPQARRVLEAVGGDGADASRLAPTVSEEERDDPPAEVVLRNAPWPRTETRFYAAACSLARLKKHETARPSDLAADFLGSETGPAARAFLALARPKAVHRQKSLATALLRVAESLAAAPPQPADPPRAFVCPWADLLAAVPTDDGRETAFQRAVREAAAVLKESHEKVAMRTFAWEVGRKEKPERDAEVETEQRTVGLLQFRLQKAREELGELREAAKTEPAFWRAAAAALTVHLMARETSLHVYNHSLGSVRLNRLPELASPAQNGWELVAATKIPFADPLRGEIDRTYRDLAQEFPGSLWEAVAWKEVRSPRGLEWVPSFQAKGPERPARQEQRTSKRDDCR